MMIPWINVQSALITYSPSVSIRICPTFPKSIPAPPDTLLTRPLENLRSRFSKDLWSGNVKIVPQIANTATNSIWNLKALIYRISFLIVPLKSFWLSLLPHYGRAFQAYTGTSFPLSQSADRCYFLKFCFPFSPVPAFSSDSESWEAAIC